MGPIYRAHINGIYMGPGAQCAKAAPGLAQPWRSLGAAPAQCAKAATLDSRCVQTGVRLVLPGELAKHAVSEAQGGDQVQQGGRRQAREVGARSPLDESKLTSRININW